MGRRGRVRKTKPKTKHYEQITNVTVWRNLQTWMENLGDNMHLIQKGKDFLQIPKIDGAVPCVCVGGGPSIKKYNHLQLLHEHIDSGYTGRVITTDRMLIPLLEEGVVPDMVCCCEGRKPVFDFFNHPLVKQFACRIDAVFATIIDPRISQLWYQYDGKVFWFNTIVDPVKIPISISRAIHYITRRTVVDMLGNVGTACIITALDIGCKPLGLIGYDLSYGDHTMRIEDTPQYQVYLGRGAKPKDIPQYFRYVYNPNYEEKYVTAVEMEMYAHILSNLLKMLTPKPDIVNCTQQGILFGENIRYMDFEDFLKQYGKVKV